MRQYLGRRTVGSRLYNALPLHPERLGCGEARGEREADLGRDLSGLSVALRIAPELAGSHDGTVVVERHEAVLLPADQAVGLASISTV